jgi:hypothetical protein
MSARSKPVRFPRRRHRAACACAPRRCWHASSTAADNSPAMPRQSVRRKLPSGDEVLIRPIRPRDKRGLLEGVERPRPRIALPALPVRDPDAEQGRAALPDRGRSPRARGAARDGPAYEGRPRFLCWSTTVRESRCPSRRRLSSISTGWARRHPDTRRSCGGVAGAAMGPRDRRIRHDANAEDRGRQPAAGGPRRPGGRHGGAGDARESVRAASEHLAGGGSRWDERRLAELTRYFSALTARPSVGRVIDEARAYRHLFPLPWPEYAQ